MFQDELRAAGITDPQLRASYSACKSLNQEHGKTYYLATLLLPPSVRPHVHALYGFARFADEIVDDLASTLSVKEKSDHLRRWADHALSDIEKKESKDPIVRALVHTIDKFEIPTSYFEAFLHSMEMDLTITHYEDFDSLYEYVYGSAAVIGLQMVHILGTLPEKKSEALIAAEKLGIAFQLANFIRDVGEDLDRGRVYLPLDELAKSGVDRRDLEKRIITPEIVNALQFQIERVRTLKRQADPGINLLAPFARPCIRAASELYCGIVDEVERIDYQIFTKRATTSTWRRFSVAFPLALQSLALR